MIYTNTLTHHGILGQKWGVRRYQNEDGTLTEAGKARYGSEVSNEEKAATIKQYNLDKAYEKTLPNDDVNVEGAIRSGITAVDGSKKLVKDIGSIARINRESIDLSNIPDEELRQKVNRLNMEQQYANLTKPGLSKGEQYALAALDIVGDLAVIGLGAYAVYKIVH